MGFISLHTQIHMLQEGHIHGLAHGIGLVCVKHDLATIVALPQGRQNVGRVVGTVAMAGNMASAVPNLARRERMERLMGMACTRTRRSTGLNSGSERQGKANGLCQDIGHLHCDGRQQFRSDQGSSLRSELERDRQESQHSPVVAHPYIFCARKVHCPFPSFASWGNVHWH